MTRIPARRPLIVLFCLLAIALGGVAVFNLPAADSLASVGGFLLTMAVFLFVKDRRVADDAAPAVLMRHQSWWDAFLDWLVGGRRRLDRAERALRKAAGPAIPGQQLAAPASADHRARDFRRATLLALQYDPGKARSWMNDANLRPPDAELRKTFAVRHVRHLHELAGSRDLDVLVSVADLAGRLGDRGFEDQTHRTIADVLNRSSEALLSDEFRSDRARWRTFFDRLSPDRSFSSFEIAMFRGRLGHAAQLATTKAQAHKVIAACLESSDLEVVDAGVDVATRFEGLDSVASLQECAGRLLDERSHRDDALARYRVAVEACPNDATNRLTALVQRCLAGVRTLAERRAYGAAAELVELLRRRLKDVAELPAARAEVIEAREVLLAEARQSFGDRIRRPAAPDRSEVYLEWSAFEEAAGEFAAAANRAEDGGHLSAAVDLFRKAELFGEAVRVRRNDNSREGLNQRAEARAAGGDHFSAAEDFRQAENWRAAIDNYRAVRAYPEMVSCLLQLHQDRAIESPEFVQAMRDLGDFNQLVRYCLEAITRHGRHPAALRELRRLLGEGKVGIALRDEVDEAIRRVNGRNRVAFEAQAQAWTAEAVGAIDKRFASIWGLDLGTSTCMVAIYDSDRDLPVLCQWHHDAGFPSTLCINQDGRELVGLRNDELAFNQLRAILANTKRDMGTDQRYTVGPAENYRPEEVAARLIGHGRMIVATMLAGQVREQLAGYARDALGDVEEEWLDWAIREHPVRLDRSKVIVTIPAYYPMAAKNATRDACVIARVELVRLIHEPTAACISATFERRQLSGRVVIVDFGAGTLDISLLDVEDRFYQVQRLSGETRLGSHDFDVRIAQALATKLRQSGQAVPATPEARHRLEVAAEKLKKSLSGQSEASESLPAFNGHDVVVTLTLQEMESIIAEPLQQLRQVCSRARPQEKIDHLVLVGGPAHSPLVRERIQDAFNRMPSTPVAEPRTAVAYGAALQAAVLDGKLADTLLLDVTPFSLGIKTTTAGDHNQYTELVAANTTIPLIRSEIFTTHHDQQESVGIEVYNGQLDREFLIGQFVLDGIPPAPRGQPKIEVRFEINSSCVLTVTAKNLESGKTQSVRITDTTLLSPGETEEMRKRLDQRIWLQQRTTALREAHRRLVDRLTETDRLNVGQLWEQLRRRLDSLDPNADARLDAETARALKDVRIAAGETATDIRTASERLAEARTQARRAADRRPGPNLDAEVAELERRERALRAAVDRLGVLHGRLTTWFTLLAQIDTSADPLTLFRERYAGGDHRGALNAARKIDLTEPSDQERRRHALAEVRDLNAYRSAAAELRAVDPQRSQTASDLAPAITVTVSTPGGRSRTAGGLLLDSDLAVTSREWFPAGGQVSVSVPGVLAVPGVAKPCASSAHLIVVQLSVPLPVPAPRLGYSALVRVGDQIEVPVTADGRYVWTPALVEQFASMNGERPETILVSLSGIDSSFTGRPVRNVLDEMIGVIVATRRFPGQATVVMAETLRRVRDER